MTKHNCWRHDRNICMDAFKPKTKAYPKVVAITTVRLQQNIEKAFRKSIISYSDHFKQEPKHDWRNTHMEWDKTLPWLGIFPVNWSEYLKEQMTRKHQYTRPLEKPQHFHTCWSKMSFQSKLGRSRPKRIEENFLIDKTHVRYNICETAKAVCNTLSSTHIQRRPWRNSFFSFYNVWRK